MTALLYGDAAITPAISVLSAVEGAKIAAPGFGDWVVPISCAILVGLFLIQQRGTAKTGTPDFSGGHAMSRRSVASEVMARTAA